MKLVQLIFFLAISICASAQTASVTKDIISGRIGSAMNDCAWNVSDEPSEITFQLIDSMEFQPFINPAGLSPRWRWKPDTITVGLRFENGWTEKRFWEEYHKNTSILNPLISKLRELHENRNWGLINDWNSFNGYEVDYLKWDQGISDAEEKSLNSLQELPDVLLNGTGVFLSLSYEYKGEGVTDNEISRKVDDLLSLLSFDVLKSKHFLCGDDLYKPDRRIVREMF